MSDFQFPRMHLIYLFLLFLPPALGLFRDETTASLRYDDLQRGGQREMAGSRRRSREGEAAEETNRLLGEGGGGIRLVGGMKKPI